MTPWRVYNVSGTVAELHHTAPLLLAPAPAGRVARVARSVDVAVVLGSAQKESTVDRAACTAAGAQVVHRRSGGGAVLVGPGSVLWVDLFVPSTDPLWCADVGRAAWWVGEAWGAALGMAGIAGAEVWRGPMVRREWSSLVCFAGLAAGEVTLASGGKKVVGISQRRGRSGALFQCACLLRWEPDRLLGLLALTPEERAAAAAAIDDVAQGVGADRGEEVLDDLVKMLP
jgi:lipoate-protein ligase A